MGKHASNGRCREMVYMFFTEVDLAQGGIMRGCKKGRHNRGVQGDFMFQEMGAIDVWWEKR